MSSAYNRLKNLSSLLINIMDYIEDDTDLEREKIPVHHPSKNVEKQVLPCDLQENKDDSSSVSEPNVLRILSSSNCDSTWWEETNKIEDKVEYTLRLLNEYFIDVVQNSLSNDMELYCLFDEKCNVDKLVGPPVIKDIYLVWSNANLVTLINMIADNAKLPKYLKGMVERYLDTVGCNHTLYKLTIPEAVPPKRNNVTDAGFDLTLVKLLKSEGGVDYFTTGVILEPPARMWYMLVPRSSMAKSGYTLANGVGIIDSGYRGEIIVALRKVNSDAPSISLPARWVQVIPQQWYSGKMINSSLLSQTIRGDNGGLGSAQFKNS